MALTLAQYKAMQAEALAAQVVDEFRTGSPLLDVLPFDNTAYPSSSGASWTYSYLRLTTQPNAGTRAVNSEFAAQDAAATKVTVDLAILGGAFEVDRVMVNTPHFGSLITFQLQQKVKAAVAAFNHYFINGDVATDPNGFDGLSKVLTGTSQEYGVGQYIDLSSATAIDSNYKVFLDLLDEVLANIPSGPKAILVNYKLLGKLRAVARRAEAYQTTWDDQGRAIDRYGGIPILDLGDRPGGSSPVIPITSRTIGANNVTGLTDLYVVYLSAGDGVTGIAPSDPNAFIRTYLPDLTQPGAVKKGEVEMVTAIAVKHSRAAAVIRNIKVS